MISRMAQGIFYLRVVHTNNGTNIFSCFESGGLSGGTQTPDRHSSLFDRLIDATRDSAYHVQRAEVRVLARSVSAAGY